MSSLVKTGLYCSEQKRCSLHDWGTNNYCRPDQSRRRKKKTKESKKRKKSSLAGEGLFDGSRHNDSTNVPMKAPLCTDLPFKVVHGYRGGQND